MPFIETGSFSILLFMEIIPVIFTLNKSKIFADYLERSEFMLTFAGN